MTDGNSVKALGGLDPTLFESSPTQTKDADPSSVTGDEFLTLLVTQLQNQDPLDPMANEEFAVQLAQFSQLEQLIEINDKTGSAGGESLNSLASYLGHEVLFDSSQVNISGGSAGSVQFTLPGDASSVSVDVVDTSGNVVETLELGAMAAGKHSPELNNLSTAAGTHELRVKATLSDGQVYEPSLAVSGVVSGFVPGPEASLLVGDVEVSPAQIKEVRALASA